MKKEPLVIEGIIHAPITKVWEYYNKPEHITHWAFASDDWEALAAEKDLRVGGEFMTTMAAKDKSVSFDLKGKITALEEFKLIEYDLEDGRHVKEEFSETSEGVKIVVTFDPEDENPLEMQAGGWQAILNTFKKYVEQ